jgi:cell division control protein 24
MAVTTASAFRPTRKQSSGALAAFTDTDMLSPSGVPSMTSYGDPVAPSYARNGTPGSAGPSRPSFGAAGGPSSADGGIGASLMSGPGGSLLMNGAPQAANTIGNKPAVAGSSLYQACLALRDRLWCVQGFGENYLSEALSTPSTPATPSPSASEPAASRPISSFDPVTQLWQLFRLGAPLCALFNHLKPNTALTINPDANRSNANECKKQVAKFIIALQNELQWDPDDCFTVSQLYLNDTNGFVKVRCSVACMRRVC